jgi:hypothetical protein
MRTDLPSFIHAVDAKPLVRFARDVASKEPAISFERNHVGFPAPLPYDLTDGVRRFILLLAVDHLPKQSERNELNTDNDEEESEEKKRPVAERSPTEEPFDGKISVDEDTDDEGDNSPDAEEVERTPDVSGREKNCQQIEESPGEPADAEFCVTILAGMVIDDLFTDPEACPVRKRRYIAMKFSIDDNLLDDLFPVRLQSAIHIMNRDSRHHRGNRIGDP